MHDEIEGRIWAAHGHQIADDLDRLFKAIHVTFCRMAAINFAAPWRRSTTHC